MASIDEDALLALFHATRGLEWKNKWDTKTDISLWHGVTVNEGRVVKLDLGYNNLRGVIPAQLGALNKLTWLGLSHNQLSGAIPAQLGQLAALEYLDLSENELIGHIPPQLGDSGALKYLDLVNNKLDGHIPPQLGNLGASQSLDLSGKRLHGKNDVMKSPQILVLPENPVSSSRPAKVSAKTFQIKNRKGVVSRFFRCCLCIVEDKVRVVNRTGKSVTVVTLPSTWPFQTKTSLMVGTPPNLVKSSLQELTAFQVSESCTVDLGQLNGRNNDVVVIVATCDGSDLYVWAKLLCKMGTVATLYPGIFGYPLFGKHPITESEALVAIIADAVFPESDNLMSAPLKSTTLTVGTKNEGKAVMELQEKKPEAFTWMAPDRKKRPTNRLRRSANVADIGEKTPEIGDNDASFAHDHFAKGHGLLQSPIESRKGGAEHPSKRGDVELSGARPIETETKKSSRFTVLADNLAGGQSYISERHGVRLKVPVNENFNDQQAAGPILLEQTAEIVQSNQQPFFISSILHCFPGGAEFSPPLQLEFSLAEDGDDCETPTYQILGRRDQRAEWTALEGVQQKAHLLRIHVYHFSQFTAGRSVNSGKFHIADSRFFTFKWTRGDTILTKHQIGICNARDSSKTEDVLFVAIPVIMQSRAVRNLEGSVEVATTKLNGKIELDIVSQQGLGYGVRPTDSLTGGACQTLPLPTHWANGAVVLVATISEGNASQEGTTTLWKSFPLRGGSVLWVFEPLFSGNFKAIGPNNPRFPEKAIVDLYLESEEPGTTTTAASRAESPTSGTGS